MTVSEIDAKLRNKFQSHKYELSNCYVYGWESDFFSITSTGYAQEIEVKVSISDFRADFGKISKHNLLKAVFEGKDKYTWSGQLEYDVWGEYKQRGEYIPFRRNYSRSNRNDESRWKKQGYNFRQLSSEIVIRDVDICPNKFWYCCPEGIIPKEEVPEYAGLYYLDQNMRMKTVKKAPFIHKQKQDLDKILLDKFYWQSMNLRRDLVLQKMQLEKYEKQLS